MRHKIVSNGILKWRRVFGQYATADTEYKWPWYGRLVGGYFTSHPQEHLRPQLPFLSQIILPIMLVPMDHRR